jgi:hypothetical protein
MGNGAGQDNPPTNGGARPSLNLAIATTFAVVGILGSILLNFAGLGSTVQASVLLALGVTSFVYYFLGGIDENTSFKIGALRVGGSLGALIGLTWFIQFYNAKISPYVFKTEGMYAWQYPQGGWDGTVEITSDHKAIVSMDWWCGAGADSRKKVQLFRQIGDGKVTESPDHSELTLVFSVVFHRFDDPANPCNATGDEPAKILSADVKRVPGFEGQVEFGDHGDKGGMVLVQ